MDTEDPTGTAATQVAAPAAAQRAASRDVRHLRTERGRPVTT